MIQRQTGWIPVMAVLVFGPGPRFCGAGAPERPRVEASGGSAEVPLVEDFQPRPGTYTYKVKWRTSRVANATVQIIPGDGFTVISVKADTVKNFDKVFKLRTQGISRIEQVPFEPVKTVIHEQVREDTKNTTIDYGTNGMVSVKETRVRPGKPTKTMSREVAGNGFTLDPLSAACLTRQVKWRLGQAASFDVVMGKDRYALTLRCTGRDTVDVGGRERWAWVIEPWVTEIDDSGERKPVESVKSAGVKVYISDDEYRDLLRIQGEPGVGKIRLKLLRFVPASSRTP